mmetsp:Transcript_26802/g.87681  ORF Transcript_26802/g.87681 Transcript_26802/m.87681 type:complete len:201 (+) Transcript_26802:600-1202(+)
MVEASSSGSPTTTASTLANNFSSKASSSDSCTSKRDVAEHTCPEHWRMPSAAKSAAASTSASSSTNNAPLPPSSSDVGRRFAADASRTARPPVPLPVKLASATRGSRVSASVARDAGVLGGPPVSRFTAPRGAQGPSNSAKNFTHVSDASGDGFSTSGQPAATAGATLSTACMSGKFQGVTRATTPTGFVSILAESSASK